MCVRERERLYGCVQQREKGYVNESNLGWYIAYVFYINFKYSMCVCACAHVHGVSNVPNKRERREGGGSVLFIMYIQMTLICRVMQLL